MRSRSATSRKQFFVPMRSAGSLTADRREIKMFPVKSKKLPIIWRTILGASFVYSTALAQSLNPGPTPPPTPGPTPIPHSFPTPTPNPGASPASGVQPGGVAIPVPVLDMAQYLPGGPNFGKDPDVPILLNRIQANYTQALNN